MGRRSSSPAGKTFGRLTVSHESRRRKTSLLWRCTCQCGREVWTSVTNLTSGNTGSCGCLRTEIFRSRTGSSNPAWKGGSSVNMHGYRVIHLNGKLVPEHRIVMERSIGRPLLRCETVHHLNGDRLDNSIDNLELWSSSHPPGQRVSDKLEWAKAFVALYE